MELVSVRCEPESRSSVRVARCRGSLNEVRWWCVLLAAEVLRRPGHVLRHAEHRGEVAYLTGPAAAANKYEEAPHDCLSVTTRSGTGRQVSDAFHDVRRGLVARTAPRCLEDSPS